MHTRTHLLLAVPVLAVLLTAGSLQAVTYTVPLCTNRPFTTAAMDFSLDLGTALSSVQSVSFQYDGNITAGRYSDGTPYNSKFIAGFYNSGAIYTSSPYAGAATWPNPEPLSGIVPMPDSGGASWTFLLDGQATGYVQLSNVMWWDGTPPPLNNPSGYMNSASLIIEATPVPEPAGLVLLAAAAFMLNRRRT